MPPHRSDSSGREIAASLRDRKDSVANIIRLVGGKAQVPVSSQDDDYNQPAPQESADETKAPTELQPESKPMRSRGDRCWFASGTGDAKRESVPAMEHIEQV